MEQFIDSAQGGQMQPEEPQADPDGERADPYAPYDPYGGEADPYDPYLQ